MASSKVVSSQAFLGSLRKRKIKLRHRKNSYVQIYPQFRFGNQCPGCPNLEINSKLGLSASTLFIYLAQSFFKKIFLIRKVFILAALGLHCCIWAFSGCERGRGCLSICSAQALVEHRLWVHAQQLQRASSSSSACGGSSRAEELNPCPLQWWTDLIIRPPGKHLVFVATCRDLIPYPGIKPRPPAPEA